MKPKWNTRFWMATLVWVGCVQAFSEPFARGPYLGQTPPGSTAQVFAPGLICNTGKHPWEANGTFSADGNTFCFNRRSGIFITENTEQGWTTPKRIKSIPYHSYSCYLSADANSIYVKCSPFNKSKRRIFHKPKGWCLRRCMRTSRGWSLPQELGPPFSDSGGGFSVSADNSICFKSRGGFWIAPFVGNTWSQVRKLPVEMGNLRGCCPGIAPDGSFLVFYSIKPGARGGTETNLYLTLRRPDGTWTIPRNMGPGINTGYYEYGARISPDKKYMFFTRSIGWDQGTLCDTADIYWVELKEHLPESYR